MRAFSSWEFWIENLHGYLENGETKVSVAMQKGIEEDGGGGGGVGALEEIENKELFDEVCRMFNLLMVNSRCRWQTLWRMELIKICR